VTRKLLKKDRRNILITWKKYREWHWKELKKFLYLGSEKMFILWEQDLAGNKRIGKKASGTENVVMSSRNMVIGEQEINYWKLWIWFLNNHKYNHKYNRKNNHNLLYCKIWQQYLATCNSIMWLLFSWKLLNFLR
jgi:hypothetical protein